VISDDSILRIADATIGYGRLRVLSGVSFSVKKGEIAALLGPNGSGKTTILRAILGNIRPTMGSLSLSRGVRLGYVPQVNTEGSFWPMKVGEFVSLFSRGGKTPVKDALRSVGISELSERNLQELSGGQRQKVLLAKALVNRPNLLLLDEPTQGMDIASERDYLRLLKNLNSEGTTVVIVTHLLHVVLAVARSVLIVQDGRTTSTDIESISEGDVLKDIYGTPSTSRERREE
jgi:zinc transport system ATP-binding protein